MDKKQSTNRYRELEERTYKFAKECGDFVKNLSKNISNIEYGKQLVRSSGSQASNYIEANEALSKKDFVYRVRICRKETKESCLWLRLVEVGSVSGMENRRQNLINEAIELRKIFNSII